MLYVYQRHSAFENKLGSPRSSCWSWRVPVHDGQLVCGVLVLLLVLGHLPPAAGAAGLQLGLGSVHGVGGVTLHTELGVKPIISVMVVLHAGQDPQVRGSEGSELGEVHGAVAGVRVAVGRRGDVILP